MSQMAANIVSDLKTVTVQSAAGPLVVIMVALHITDAVTVDHFIEEVAEKFKLQRMTSPPETKGLLVTIIGELSAARFARRWRELTAIDHVLSQFMSRMHIADVIRGTPSGQPVEGLSLLEAI